MKGADEVFAQRMVDADFPADRTVDLGEQCGRDLDDWDTTQIRRRGKPRNVARDAAANRDDQTRTVGVGSDERIVDAAHGRELFITLAIRNEYRVVVGRTSQILAVKPPDGVA